MRQAFKIISSKYLIALAGFAVLMLFFDRNDVFTQLERKKELRNLEATRRFYQEEIARTRRELEELQNNPAALERYAREKYFMKKDNEDVFIVETDSLPGQ